jgi:predicted phosphodiesterase
MMIAILSDIHGNLEAFQAVIDDMEARKPGRVICLGDLIGYGPDPDEVVRLFRKKGYLSVLGNHEAALQSRSVRNRLNEQVRKNSIETEKLLSRQSHAFCRGLPNNMTVENALFVHGFPPSSVLRYVSMASDSELVNYFKEAETDICFVGHSHDLCSYCWAGDSLKKEKLDKETYRLHRGKKYIVNVGSVGQPRDGTNSAKYILWESEAYRLEIIRIPYDYKTTSRKIEARGFPEIYARRLW